MKPGFNHQTRAPGGNVYWWRYYERKVGVYLTLGTPLAASADAKSCFRSWIQVEPRDVVHFGRGTYRLKRMDRRGKFYRDRPNVYHRVDDLRMSLTPVIGMGFYETVADLGSGLSRERWNRGQPTGHYISPTLDTKSSLTLGTSRLKGTPDDLVTFDLAPWHEKFNAMLTGCVVRGEFTPLVDWVVENSPESVARLFTEPGVT